MTPVIPVECLSCSPEYCRAFECHLFVGLTLRSAVSLVGLVRCRRDAWSFNAVKCHTANFVWVMYFFVPSTLDVYGSPLLLSNSIWVKWIYTLCLIWVLANVRHSWLWLIGSPPCIEVWMKEIFSRVSIWVLSLYYFVWVFGIGFWIYEHSYIKHYFTKL